jgi:hypothetical protein
MRAVMIALLMVASLVAVGGAGCGRGGGGQPAPTGGLGY